jgi:hypothetical protein
MMRSSRDCVAVNLLGGLGNQLFQLAAGHAVQLGTGLRLRMIANELYSGMGLVEFEDVFAEFLPSSDWSDRQLATLLGRIPWAPQTATAALARDTVARIAGYKRLAPSPFAGQLPRIQHGRRGVLLDGYFQHPDWYEPGIGFVLDRLVGWAQGQADFSHRLSPNVATVFVRRGDYPLSWRLNDAYYAAAIESVVQRGAAEFEVISADPSAVEDIRLIVNALGQSLPVRWQARPPLADLLASTGTRFTILANSTFAWWAARLADTLFPGRERIVIGPDPWMTDVSAQLIRLPWEKMPAFRKVPA